MSPGLLLGVGSFGRFSEEVPASRLLLTLLG